MPNVPSTDELLTTIRKGTEYLEAMASKLEFPWNPETASDDPRKLHNMYARNLITSYVSRFAEQCGQTDTDTLAKRSDQSWALGGMGADFEAGCWPLVLVFGPDLAALVKLSC